MTRFTNPVSRVGVSSREPVSRLRISFPIFCGAPHSSDRAGDFSIGAFQRLPFEPAMS